MSADASGGPLPPGGMNDLAARLSQPEFGHPLQVTDDFCACLLLTSLRPPTVSRHLLCRRRWSTLTDLGCALLQGSGFALA